MLSSKLKYGKTDLYKTSFALLKYRIISDKMHTTVLVPLQVRSVSFPEK